MIIQSISEKFLLGWKNRASSTTTNCFSTFLFQFNFAAFKSCLGLIILKFPTCGLAMCHSQVVVLPVRCPPAHMFSYTKFIIVVFVRFSVFLDLIKFRFWVFSRMVLLDLLQDVESSAQGCEGPSPLASDKANYFIFL